MTAKYYRDVARQKLAGNWKTSVIVALIAWFLGGLLVSATVGGSITIQGETYTIPAIQAWVLSALKIGTILGIVQFVVGGVVRQGYATFLLKQYDGEKTEIHDLSASSIASATVSACTCWKLCSSYCGACC